MYSAHSNESLQPLLRNLLFRVTSALLWSVVLHANMPSELPFSSPRGSPLETLFPSYVSPPSEPSLPSPQAPPLDPSLSSFVSTTFAKLSPEFKVCSTLPLPKLQDSQA